MKPRANWNCIGSAPFVITLLAVLGLGGGFLLAFLPFNSADHSATSRPRSFPEFRSFPSQDSTPPAERSPGFDTAPKDPDPSVVPPLAPINARMADVLVATEDQPETADALVATKCRPETADPKITAPFLCDTSFRGSATVIASSFPSAPPPSVDSPNSDVPAMRMSADSDSLKTALIPEPTTWTLFVLSILVFACARLRRRFLARWL
jgi:hypothetical protein